MSSVIEGEISQSAVEQEPAERPVFVKPEWFEAYVEGNARVPQVGGLGYMLQVSECVFRDPNINWVDFSQSELSETQLRSLGAMMTRIHKSYNIAIPYDRNLDEMVEGRGKLKEVVSDEVFQELWGRARRYTIDFAVRYANNVLRERNQSALGNSDYQQLDRFWQYPENRKEIEKISRVLSAMVEALKTVEGKKLLTSYRNELENYHDERKNRREIWSNYWPEIRLLFLNHLKSANLGVPQSTINSAVEFFV